MMQNRFPLYLCLKISSFVAFSSFAQPGQARMNRSAIVRTSGVSDTWHLRRLGDRAGGRGQGQEAGGREQGTGGQGAGAGGRGNGKRTN